MTYHLSLLMHFLAPLANVFSVLKQTLGKCVSYSTYGEFMLQSFQLNEYFLPVQIASVNMM